jgi:caa(3)-type oxidase subunit IV
MSSPQYKVDPKEIEDVRRHIRQHVIIAIGLVIGTVLTVLSSRTDFHNPSINIAIAMAIASVQGFFIVGFFMHLISEKKMIYSVLVITAFFFVVQMAVTVWARSHGNEIHIQP